MKHRARQILQEFALALLFGAWVAGASAQGEAKRGEYLAKAGGCFACHTDDTEGAVPFAGGRALKTIFGTFYGPNITPHAQAGIGRWAETDFIRAMRVGVRPAGAHYYPAFPYPSYTKISEADLRDLWAFLRTLPPSSRINQAHDLRFPYRWRFLVPVWKWLYFKPGPFVTDPRLAQSVNRGAYLVQALGHCSECHTPRDFLGGPKRNRFLAGGRGPDGKRVPNLTPIKLKKWDDRELKEFLLTGLTPDSDAAAGAMHDVINNTTSQLTPEDLGALIAYLRTLSPLADEPR